MKKFRITVDGKTYEVEVEELASQNINTSIPVTPISNVSASVSSPVSVPEIKPITNKGISAASAASETSTSPASASTKIGGGTEVKAPVTGTILRVEVKQGDSVQKGQNLIVLEAMKMETEVQSPVSGTIVNILTSNGANVESGQTLFVIDSDSV